MTITAITATTTTIISTAREIKTNIYNTTLITTIATTAIKTLLD